MGVVLLIPDPLSAFEEGLGMRLVRFEVLCKASYRILRWWGGGGGGQNGSRMLVACEMCACLQGGSGGIPSPPGKFEIYILSDCF